MEKTISKKPQKETGPNQFSIFALLSLMAFVGVVLVSWQLGIGSIAGILVTGLVLSTIFSFESSSPKAVKSDPVSLILVGLLFLVIYYGVSVLGLV